MKQLDVQVGQVTEAVSRSGNNTRVCNAIGIQDDEANEKTAVFEANAVVSTDTDHLVDTTQPSQKNRQNPVSTDTAECVGRHTPSTKPNEPNKRQTTKPPTPTETKAYKTPLPYPKAPKKTKKETEQARCQEMMEELSIRVPYFEACNLGPSVKKYVKKMVNNSMSFEDGVIAISDTCSHIFQAKMPKKLQDPGSFTLSCTIGHLTFERSLCDLGSSVNVMPLSVAKRLGFTEFFYTPLTLILADKSTRTPEGILVDILVKIGDCWILADFIVLDYKPHEPKDPIILGRPFLATAGALIDCREGIITLRLDDVTLEFDMTKEVERPTVDGQTFVIESRANIVELDKHAEGDTGYMVEQACDQRVDKQMKIEAELNKASAEPVTAVKQKAPDITHHHPKQRYEYSKPSTGFSGRCSTTPKRAHPSSAIPVYLGRPHAQNAYSPPWMRRLSKGPRPP